MNSKRLPRLICHRQVTSSRCMHRRVNRQCSFNALYTADMVTRTFIKQTKKRNKTKAVCLMTQAGKKQTKPTEVPASGLLRQRERRHHNRFIFNSRHCILKNKIKTYKVLVQRDYLTLHRYLKSEQLILGLGQTSFKCALLENLCGEMLKYKIKRHIYTGKNFKCIFF